MAGPNDALTINYFIFDIFLPPPGGITDLFASTILQGMGTLLNTSILGVQ